MTITNTLAIILTASSVVTALSVLYGKFIRPIKQVINKLKENENQIRILDDSIASLRIDRSNDNEFSTEIRAMLLESLIAVLDGLEQTGANHLVTEQKQKLITFLTKQV